MVQRILSRARDRLVIAEARALIKDAAELLLRPHTNLLVVCDCGVMVGVVTKTDIVSQVSRHPLGPGFMAPLEAIMTRDVASCGAEDSLPDVWQMMKARNVQRVPVLDTAHRPIGVIYARDALQGLLGEVETEDELLREYIAGVGYR